MTRTGPSDTPVDSVDTPRSQAPSRDAAADSIDAMLASGVDAELSSAASLGNQKHFVWLLRARRYAPEQEARVLGALLVRALQFGSVTTAQFLFRVRPALLQQLGTPEIQAAARGGLALLLESPDAPGSLARAEQLIRAAGIPRADVLDALEVAALKALAAKGTVVGALAPYFGDYMDELLKRPAVAAARAA